MYAIMNTRGKLFAATDVMQTKGRKLIFVSEGEFVHDIRHSESGDIFTPGNGHNVGYWGHTGVKLYIDFIENSGDLRQLTNNIFPYIGEFNIATKKLKTIQWRRYGTNGKTYDSFKKLIDSFRYNNIFVDNSVSYKQKIVKIEGLYDMYGEQQRVCTVWYNKETRRVTRITLFNMSAESINDVFEYFGNCKFTGNVDNIAVTDASFTDFGTYQFIDIKENEHVFRVTDRASHGSILVNKGELKQLIDKYNKAQQRYKLMVEEYELKLGVNGRYKMHNCHHYVYFGGTPEE